MRVPDDILAIERPRYTIVEPYSSGRYAVRTRIDRFDDKGNLEYRKNQVIGYITDKFCPSSKEKRIKSFGRIDSKMFGAAFLYNKLCKDILDDLCEFYDYLDAEWIYCAALLRACYPGLCDCKMESRFKHSFVSEMYKGAVFNKDRCTKMFTLLGEQFTTTEKFMMKRLKDLDEDDLVIIDGSLKQDNGKENTYSRISRKTAAAKVCHHLMMYAYSPKLEEPLGSKIYSGNVPDAVAVKDFVERLNIFSGLIVADRGFRPEAMTRVIAKHEGLHYLVPLIKGREVTVTSDVFSFNDVLMKDNGPISCKKCKAKDKDGNDLGYWLYSYKDSDIEALMKKEYLEHHASNLDPKLFEAEAKWFGTLVLQSDAELDAEFAYNAYDDRWGIEPLFKLQKTGLDIDTANEKSDETLIGSEFVNFVATLMATRLRKHLAQFDSCRNRSFQDLLSELCDCVKVKEADGDWEYRTSTNKDMKFYVKVGAVTDPDIVKLYTKPEPVAPAVPGKRGRPKGRKDSSPRKRRTVAEMTAARSDNKST